MFQLYPKTLSEAKQGIKWQGKVVICFESNHGARKGKIERSI